LLKIPYIFKYFIIKYFYIIFGNITYCEKVLQIDIKMEGPYHKSQQDLSYLVKQFHFDIDLDINWRTFLQGILCLVFSLSNQYLNQDQNGNDLPNKVSLAASYGMHLSF
jgi:hypothetical protein